MKTNIIIYSEELTKEDIQLLLQGIRDSEQRSFPEKKIGVAVFAPDLSMGEIEGILQSIKPGFAHVQAFKGGAI